MLGKCMSAKDIADLFLEGTGKIEFYWNFYTVTLLALFGWFVTSSPSMNVRLKCLLTVAYLGFAAMNLLGLWGSYAFTEAIRHDLLSMPIPEMPHTRAALLAKSYESQRNWGLAVHLLVDAFVLLVIWRCKSGKDVSHVA